MQEQILAAREKKHIDLYEGFSNEITGESFRCLSYSPKACTFEWKVQPNGYVPFSHIHLHQDEVFRVRRGELRLVIDKKETIAKAGEIVRVSKGKSHRAFNNGQEMLECVVSFEPGLDTYEFFQCFGGLTVNGDMDARGQINIPKMLYFTKRMNARCLARPSALPATLFKLALNACYLVGKLSGWERDYFRYTGGGENYSRPIL